MKYTPLVKIAFAFAPSALIAGSVAAMSSAPASVGVEVGVLPEGSMLTWTLVSGPGPDGVDLSAVFCYEFEDLGSAPAIWTRTDGGISAPLDYVDGRTAGYQGCIRTAGASSPHLLPDGSLRRMSLSMTDGDALVSWWIETP